MGFAVAGVLGVLLSVVPAVPAVAAGQPNVEVTITNASGTPIDVVPSTGGFEYQVRASYTCVGDTDCTNMTVSIEAPSKDPYYGTHLKEASGTWTPPFSPAPAATGSWNEGWTIHLGTVRSGDIGTIVFSYFIKGPVGSPGSQIVNNLCCGNFFPPGFPIDPEVTVTADNVAPVTDSDLATYQSIVPTPSLAVSAQAKVKTDTEFPVTIDAVSNCWRRNGYRTFKAIYTNLCSDSASITVQLPANAEYVAGSGGTYDAGTHAVTVTAGPDAWRGLEGEQFRVTFSSADYPTSGTGCAVSESFVASGTVTYLNGDVKATSPATYSRAVTVDNCQPFAKGTFGKTATGTRYKIPTTTPTAGYWQVDTSNQSNVPAIATVTDTSLDQPGLPVHSIRTNTAATINYTLDDGTTGSATGTTYTAPSERRIVSATVVSEPLAGPNLTPTGTAGTLFRVVYDFTVQPGATAGDRVNTASATLTYPENPELGTFTPTGSPDTHTIELYTVVPFAKASMNKVPAAASYAIPATTTPTYGGWRVDVCNGSNVDGVATVTDDNLDLPDLPVYQIRTSGTATITYTLDNGVSDTLTGLVFTAPTGRRIVSATVVSSTLVGPNTTSTGTACTYFSVHYDFAVEQGAAPGERSNTATATMEYPNTDLGTVTATDSPDTATLNLYSPATPYTINASALTVSNTTSPGFPPRAGDEVPWKANGQFCNLATDKTIRPQYVFLAPKDWNILAGGVSVAGVPDVTVTPTTVTYSGITYNAVIVTWPEPVAGVGTTAGSNCVTLGQLTVKTTPTLSAVMGSQTARFFVGDAAGVPAETYSGNVREAATGSDIDADGNTTDTFASSTASTTLTGVPGLLPVKEICQPNAEAADGCTWISDPAVTVGVPPEATSIKYRVTIRNTGQTNLTNVVVYDVLPYPGDVGTMDSTASTPRGSTVKEELSSLTADSPSGMTIEYSTSTNPPRPEVFSGATAGTWGSTLLGASAIKATIPTLNAQTSRTFTYEAALVGASADQTACNSLAISADTMVDSEPPRVCATTQEAEFRIDPTERLPLQASRVGVVPFLVNNGGGSALATATVTISVPAEVEIVDLAPAGWECSAPSMSGPVDVTCNPVNGDGSTRSLAMDVPETIALQVKPTEAAPAELCFNAAVEGLMSDPDPDNNTAQSCSTALGSKPELFLSKDDAKASVAVGEEFTYTITALNGLVGEPVDGVSVTDTLPASLEFVSSVPGPSSQSGQVLTWDLGQLGQAAVPGDGGGDQASGGAGSSKSVTVTVRVADGAQDSVTNTAQATGADPADSSITLTANASDTNVILNVFTDLGAEETTPQNTPVTTPLADIASTTGAPLDPSLVTQATAPTHGSLSIDALTGAVTYSPAPGHSGDDSYQVQVCDTTAPAPQCFVATVVVHVGVNTVTAVDDALTTDAGVPGTFAVLLNDTSATGQPLANPTVTSDPANGTTVVNGDGSITYTPNPATSGEDVYTYQVCDTSHPTPVCDTAQVTVTVMNAGTGGPATEGIQTPHNTPISTPLSELASVSGAPLDPSTVNLIGSPSNGTVAIDPTTGAVTYTPNPGYAGPDSYRVSMCDTSTPTAQCHDVEVPVTVLANVVTAPDLEVDTHTNAGPEPIDLTTTSASGQALALPTITTEPAHGTVVVNPDGTVTYTPGADYGGPDSFTYQVCDTSHPTPVCDTGVVNVTVARVADLATTKDLTTTEVVAGLPVTYEVALTNQGPATATDVHSIDPIPAAITDPIGTPDPDITGATCTTRDTVAADLDRLDPGYGPYSLSSHPKVVDCTYPALPAGTTVHDTITGTVDPAVIAGTELVNQTTTYATTYDPAFGDNLAATTSEVDAIADLVLTKTIDDDNLRVGDEATYTITVTNNGPSLARDVQVKDTPTGLRLYSADTNTGQFTNNTWHIGDLRVGESVTLTTTYEVTDTTIGNTAVVSAADTILDPQEENNADEATRVAGTTASDDRLPITGPTAGLTAAALAALLLLVGTAALTASRRRRKTP